MAKSNSFFGKRRGSTKNFTFTVFNGHQVTKEKAEQVKNPRTLAQMRNRMVLTTSSAAYAAMKEIVDHSFQGYTYGLQNMSRFQSVNNMLLRDNIGAATPQFAYCNYGKAQLLPGAYQVSEGSASAISHEYNKVSVRNTSFAVEFGNLYFGNTVSADNCMKSLGIAVGELATFVAILPLSGGLGHRFVFLRITALKAGNVALTSENLDEYFKIESNYPSQAYFNVEGKVSIHLNIGTVDTAAAYAWGCIHSKLNNSVWQRSSETLVLVNDGALAPSSADALATYPVGTSYILNDGDFEGGYDTI